MARCVVEDARVSYTRWAQHGSDEARYGVSMASANASKGGLPAAGEYASATLSRACIFRGLGLHRHHRTRCQSDDTCSDIAHAEVCQTSAPVGAEHEQGHLLMDRRLQRTCAGMAHQ